MENTSTSSTIQERLTNLYRIREEIRELDAVKKALQADYEQEEYYLIEKMQAEKVTTAGIANCTASLKQEKYPKVDDMESFVTWCAQNGRADMIQKRISKAAFDEYYATNNEYPDGVDTYDKLTLGLRKR